MDPHRDRRTICWQPAEDEEEQQQQQRLESGREGDQQAVQHLPDPRDPMTCSRRRAVVVGYFGVWKGVFATLPGIPQWLAGDPPAPAVLGRTVVWLVCNGKYLLEHVRALVEVQRDPTQRPWAYQRKTGHRQANCTADIVVRR